LERLSDGDGAHLGRSRAEESLAEIGIDVCLEILREIRAEAVHLILEHPYCQLTQAVSAVTRSTTGVHGNRTFAEHGEQTLFELLYLKGRLPVEATMDARNRIGQHAER